MDSIRWGRQTGTDTKKRVFIVRAEMNYLLGETLTVYVFEHIGRMSEWREGPSAFPWLSSCGMRKDTTKNRRENKRLIIHFAQKSETLFAHQIYKYFKIVTRGVSESGCVIFRKNDYDYNAFKKNHVITRINFILYYKQLLSASVVVDLDRDTAVDRIDRRRMLREGQVAWIVNKYQELSLAVLCEKWIPKVDRKIWNRVYELTTNSETSQERRKRDSYSEERGRTEKWRSGRKDRPTRFHDCSRSAGGGRLPAIEDRPKEERRIIMHIRPSRRLTCFQLTIRQSSLKKRTILLRSERHNCIQ